MFISKADIYREGKYERLRQYCPQFDPLFVGVEWEDGHEPVPVMKSPIVARVHAEKQAKEQAKVEKAEAKKAMTPEQQATTNLDEMSWRELVSYARALGIKTHGIGRDELTKMAIEAKIAKEAA